MAEHLFCSMCVFNTLSSEHLLKHTVRDHKNDPNFRVHCSLCGSSFEKWNSFQKHVQRKHGHEEEESPGINGNSFNDDNFGGGNDDIPIPCNIDQQNFSSHNEEMQWNAAKYILTLKEQRGLTQATVDTTLEATKDLVKQVVEGVKQKLKEKLQNGINIDEIIQEENPVCSGEVQENNVFDTSFLFEEVESQYLQTKLFTEKFGLVEPQPVKLGEKRCWKTVSHKRRAVKVDALGYVVPFLENLQNLLCNENVLEEIDNPHQCSVSTLKDVCDGSFFRTHPIFSVDLKALSLLAYYDDVEMCNPLGSKTKKHKIGVFYYTLGNLSPRYRSSLRTIQLIAIARTVDIRQFGVENLLEPFVRSINMLARDEGYAFQLRNEIRVFRGTLLAFCADTLGSHFIAGIVEGVGGSLRKCRNCWCTADDMNSKFVEEDYEPRDLEQHLRLCQMAKDLDMGPFVKTTFGITGLSTLNNIRYFDIIKCFPQDIMHCIYEGVLPLELKLLLQYAILEKKWITTQELNRRIDDFDYDYLDLKDKPTTINREVLKPTSTKKISQSAAQMVCLAFNLPFLIGDVIPTEDNKWRCFQLLLKITSICSSYEIENGDTQLLRILIAEHHALFRDVYPERRMTPKTHYMVHMPSQILRFGPLRNLWCMRFEAKNSYFKSLPLKNFKNIPLTLARRHQSNMCMHLLGTPTQGAPNYLYKGDVVVEGQVMPLEDHASYQEISNLLHLQHGEKKTVMSTARVSVQGIHFRLGCYVKLNDGQDLFPRLATVEEILVIEDSKFLVVKQATISEYSHHYFAYRIGGFSDKKEVTSVSDLNYKFPLYAAKVHGQKYVQIRNYATVELDI